MSTQLEKDLDDFMGPLAEILSNYQPEEAELFLQALLEGARALHQHHIEREPVASLIDGVHDIAELNSGLEVLALWPSRRKQEDDNQRLVEQVQQSVKVVGAALRNAEFAILNARDNIVDGL